MFDVKQFWNASKITWLRKILTKEFNELDRSAQQQNLNQPPTNPHKTTEDWLIMLMNEIATISRDIDITPIRMLTTWGTQKLRKYGLELKKLILEKNLHKNRKTRRRLPLQTQRAPGGYGFLGQSKDNLGREPLKSRTLN